MRGKNFEVTVSYFTPTITMLGERTLDFTTLGKEQLVYDISNPYVDGSFVSKLDSVIDENTDKILVNTGMKDSASIVYNMLYSVIKVISKVVGFVK